MRIQDLKSAAAPLGQSESAISKAPASSLILLGSADAFSPRPKAGATRSERLADALGAAVMASVPGVGREAVGHLRLLLDGLPAPSNGAAAEGEKALVDHLRGAILPMLRSRETWDVGWHCLPLARLAESMKALDINEVSRGLYSGEQGVAWKEFSDGYFDRDQARATYDVLRESGVIPAPDKPLRFVSASANAATHEAAMYERDVELAPKRPGGRQFMVGDIADVPNRAYPGPPFPRGEFIHSQWDGTALPFAKNSIDVIWDRKGCLWFTLTTDKLDGKATPLALLGVLDHYHSILKPGGSIVVDAIEGFDLVSQAANMSGRGTALHYLKQGGELPAGVTPQAEQSTADGLNNVARDSGVDLMALIATRFDVRVVGEGKTRCLVFRSALGPR